MLTVLREYGKYTIKIKFKIKTNVLKMQFLLFSIVIYNNVMFFTFCCTCCRAQIAIVGFMMAAANVSVPIAIIMASMKVVVLLAPMMTNRMRNLIMQLLMRVKTTTICLGIMVKMIQIIIEKKKILKKID